MKMLIGDRKIGRGEPCFIVAECGSSHGGELDEAFLLIDSAAGAGADCVKFQVIIADEIVHPLTGEVELPGGKVHIYRRFKELERDREFYRRIKEHTEEQGLVFLCSPFGIESARMLYSLDVRAIKIASPELNHYPLLEEVSRYNVPLILSTGVSKLREIEKAVSFSGDKSILLHCITAYPAPEEEYNLKLIPNLGAIFGRPVGVSDHSRDPVMIPVLSVLMEACLVEKHFTLSTNGSGLDDPIALDPAGFSLMVREIRQAEKGGEKKAWKRLEKMYGKKAVARILGDGVKRLAPSERINYITTNRSLIALSGIAEGEVLSLDKVGILRSEKNLKPGLSPEYLKVVLGRAARQTIPAGTGITWEDI